MFRVIAHGPMLVQVIANLISNAVNFVVPGVETRLKLWAGARAGRAGLRVEDNGVGISVEDQDAYFTVSNACIT